MESVILAVLMCAVIFVVLLKGIHVNININYPVPQYTEADADKLQKAYDEEYEAEQQKIKDAATAVQDLFLEKDEVTNIV